MALILDGRAAAGQWRQELSARVAQLSRDGTLPSLVMIRVGEDPASVAYVRGKEKAASEIGIHSQTLVLPADIGPERLRTLIYELNRDDAVHGILLQLPLPRELPVEDLLAGISPAKDVDGFHPLNVGRLCLGLPAYVPATPLGIVRMLAHYGIGVAGRRVVVLGRSRVVGRPLANLLSGRGPAGNATVTLCHTATLDLASITRGAEILIVAAGRQGMVGADMVAPGAVVIDVGMHREPDPERPGKLRLCGDVDFAAVAACARAITPVPGGVGPMTVAGLLENTVQAAARVGASALAV